MVARSKEEVGVSVWKDEEVLEVGSNDGCTSMQMHLIPLN